MRLALVVAICLVSNLCSAQTDRQLVDRYDKLVSVENYAGALKAAQTIVDRYPESATWQFNLGCMLTRANQTNHHESFCLNQKGLLLQCLLKNIDSP